MPRWVIHSRTTFNAHHALTSYLGQAEESHEHLWEIAIKVGTDSLNEEGFALDFHEVHNILDKVAEPLRGSDLNQHQEIGVPTPSAERLAEVMAGTIEPKLTAIGGTLLTVSVWEGPGNRVDLCLS
jgi:6-pyruvoyltetrahydropterin/6-carboxytetrahydropterin synthase